MCFFVHYTFSYSGLVDFGRAIFRVVQFCTVATCYARFALGSYMAVFLTLIALLQSALSVVSLALEYLALPDKSSGFGTGWSSADSIQTSAFLR